MTIKMFAIGMQCEMCGNTVPGPGKTVRIEGATLRVCSQCARFGTEVPAPRKIDSSLRPSPAGKSPVPQGRSPAPPRRTRDVFDMIEGELVEDYGERIRKARIAKGLTQKDLALQMMERELLVRRIEKGDLIPEDEVRKKIERILEIKLLDTAEAPIERTRGSTMAPTLGDVISIRKTVK